METSSNLNFFKVVVVRLVFLTAIHFCLDRPGICTQLEENSSSLLKKFTSQICFAKQTFIQNKSLFVQTRNDYKIAMLFFLTSARAC